MLPGCGLAHDVEALAGVGYEVTGVDLARTAIARARDRLDGAPGTELVVGDFLALPDTLESRFDAVVEHTCFCAVGPEHYEAYMSAAARALRPGGRLLGAFLDFEGGGPPWGTSAAELRSVLERRFAIELCERAPEMFEPAEVPQLAVCARLVEGRA